ncbi:hypothetical protein BT93_L0008 [Corymbia citriodora subsp. variegata]|uniref:3-oxo-5-alpha-steroid 4-dehydrogenase C-terminal domain-containing protein n=1 Tax=Corymbia citriodora subsp. variegata TaxID=360336 RepID=A0A8T0CEV2_CORYI|nr:hypothetical protein BT93_L0008 [Corymbia citriodora subsp. variegata]
MTFLYLAHYTNRAIITPLFLAPSMSPIHPTVAASMVIFQYFNSSVLACWLVYTHHDYVLGSVQLPNTHSPLAFAGLVVFLLGAAGNISSENALFSLRRAAARRKAKAEGKAQITYSKVYVVPPVEGYFSRVLYPHYSLEWLEWMGYWILGGACGLGWGTGFTGYAKCSGALWFLFMEISVMLPRAVKGLTWYEQKFGKRALAGRKAAIPGVI